MRYIVFSAVALCLSVTSSHASCTVDRFRFQFGEDTTAAIHLNGSRDCTISLSIGRKTDAQSFQITQKPAHGAASWNGSLATPRIRYQASPGYKGSDEFVFSASGSTITNGGVTGFSGVANVRVSADVQ
jgi:hypothetical protein